MDLNPFRLCSGLKVLGYFMILIVLAIVALSYYAVVVLSWGPHLLDGGFTSFLSFTIIITFHILLVLLMWSYIKVVIQDPGSVPENWKLVSEQNIEEGNSVALSDYASIENPTPTLSTDQLERRQSQSRGYCCKCQNGKPPRCHHCSVCQRCVLKMDHHCIWVVNCVGARNYKFFLLFVMYTFLTTTLDALVLLPSFIKFFRQAKNHSLSPGNIAVIFLVFATPLRWRFMRRKKLCSGSMTWAVKGILNRFLAQIRHYGFCHCSRRKIWRTYRHYMEWNSQHVQMQKNEFLLRDLYRTLYHYPYLSRQSIGNSLTTSQGRGKVCGHPTLPKLHLLDYTGYVLLLPIQCNNRY